jgi:hypothetical protein
MTGAATNKLVVRFRCLQGGRFIPKYARSTGQQGRPSRNRVAADRKSHRSAWLIKRHAPSARWVLRPTRRRREIPSRDLRPFLPRSRLHPSPFRIASVSWRSSGVRDASSFGFRFAARLRLPSGPRFRPLRGAPPRPLAGKSARRRRLRLGAENRSESLARFRVWNKINRARGLEHAG